MEPKGTLTIDAGAVDCFARGKKPVAGGRDPVEGQFARGDAVVVRQPRHPRDRPPPQVTYDAEDADEDQGPLLFRLPRKFSASAAAPK